MQHIYQIKIRLAFDSYHRNRYGYYPTWDEIAEEYFAKGTQEKWSDWQSFFLNHSQEVLESASPHAMADIYLKVDAFEQVA